MKKRIMLTLVCLLAAIGWVAAQNSPITGIVISAEDNEPIIGASVLVKGSTTGAVTDLDGKFTITDAPAGAKILQVSFVGMITQEVPVTPGTIRVTLKNDAKLLDEVNTKIESKTFKTKELAAGATFEVKFTCYYNGADFTITPSDLEFPYYSAIRPAFRYQGLDDDALLQTIIAEDSFMLDFMAAPGVYEYKNEGVYLPDTEYWVLIFGWAAGAPTTSIQKFPFRTSKPNIDPAACQFTVTHSDLTSRGMNISIEPSDDTVPYMFDLISEADYERYKADMKAYVTEYVGQDIDNLDNNRVCGQSGYSYTKVLEPGTKYYVWVASIDEFGKPQADVYISDPITTLPKAVSDATVTATIDKYFNGDDLYALDNEKYADCRGQAYVMVTFAAENAKEWYGTMVAEDPNDPTSAISDDEVIETLLVGGTWCPTGKLYLCKWDTEHTILAVGVAADENPGVLLRQSHTFTKAGASPVSEFVAPESQGVRTGTMRIAPHVASVRNYK